MSSITPSPFPFVSVAGAPFERGRQYGVAVASRVRRSASIYATTLDELGYDAAAKARLIKEFAAEIGSFGADYLEEMEGIARGAGVPFEDVIMINARTEVVAKARQETGKPEEEPEDGCTGVVVLPERSATASVLHAQNWDWRAECAETAIVLRVEQENGPDFLTFVEAGGLARCGMNAAGISITANYLECNRDFQKPGVPLALIRRKVLEQEHFALAMKAVAATPKACSNNMMLGTVDGFAIDFECAPDEAFPLYPENGLIVHANHWVSATALSKLVNTGVPSVPESFYRDWRVRRLLDAVGERLTMDDLKTALFDDFGTPYSVCRPPRPGGRGNLSATVSMVVMEPAAGSMDVAPLPALCRTFTRYSLKGDPATLPVAAE